MAILSTESKVQGNSVWESHKVFNDQSVDETKSDAIDVTNAKGISLAVEAGAGVSGGVVKLEGAITSDYAGTWAELASLTVNAASKLFLASVDLGDSASIPMKYVRARIETVLSGGTIDTYILVQK
jgi:hypothetical protein